MSFSAPVDLGQLDCWPLCGFAPGGYTSKCDTCGVSFVGDKRAYRCLECAVKSVKTNVSKLDDDCRGLAALASTVPRERIVAAAVFHGCTISLPPPARHHTILNFMATTMGIDTKQVHPVNQGFLTSTGRFVNRSEAYYIAWNQKQILSKTGNKDVPTLYSEDLW